MHIFGIPRVHRLLLRIWFPWTPPVLTLELVKERRENTVAVLQLM